MSGIFSIASHSTLQYFPELVGHEQTGCAHFGVSAVFIVFPGFAAAISFLLSSNGGLGNFPSPPLQSDSPFILFEILAEGDPRFRKPLILAREPGHQTASENESWLFSSLPCWPLRAIGAERLGAPRDNCRGPAGDPRRCPPRAVQSRSWDSLAWT